MREIRLETSDGKASMLMSAGGRRLLCAGGQELGRAVPPSFESTGLACRVCYKDMAEDMPELLWLLVDRLRRRAMRQAYRQRH